MIHADFAGNLVIVGFGSIGQGVVPLILRHIRLDRGRIVIVTAEERGHDVAESYGIRFVVAPLVPENYRQVLEPLLGPGDFLLNLSVDVASTALIELARDRGALYLDTCIEPWAGGYTDTTKTPSQRSNYALRESALALREGAAGGPQSGHRLPFRQGGTAQHRRRHRALRRGAGRPRRLGRARARPLGQGDPYRRAGHPGGAEAETGR